MADHGHSNRELFGARPVRQNSNLDWRFDRPFRKWQDRRELGQLGKIQLVRRPWPAELVLALQVGIVPPPSLDPLVFRAGRIQCAAPDYIAEHGEPSYLLCPRIISAVPFTHVSFITGPLKSMVTASRYPFRCTVTPGKRIAAVYSNFRLPLELQFAMHTIVSMRAILVKGIISLPKSFTSRLFQERTRPLTQRRLSGIQMVPMTERPATRWPGHQAGATTSCTSRK